MVLFTIKTMIIKQAKKRQIAGIRKLGGLRNIPAVMRAGLNSNLTPLQYARHLDPTGNISPELQNHIANHLTRLRRQDQRKNRIRSRFTTRKIELTDAERVEIEKTNVDIRAVRDKDKEKKKGDLRPTFYELGVEFNHQTERDAQKEVLQYAMFNHVKPGFSKGETNPLYLQNEAWNRQVRFRDNNVPMIKNISPNDIMYYKSPVDNTSTMMFNPNVEYVNMPFRDINDDRAIYRPTAETNINTHMTKLYPTTTNYEQFRNSNHVIYPTRGTAQPLNAGPAQKDINTGIYQTGISPYSFYFQ